MSFEITRFLWLVSIFSVFEIVPFLGHGFSLAACDVRAAKVWGGAAVKTKRPEKKSS